MAKFYGYNAVFPLGRFGQTIAERNAPSAMPAGSIVPASPAGFPPYQIRPEVIGSLPQKQVVPPLFDPKTAASFMRGGNAGSVPVVPVIPGGAAPIGSPAPVVPFFTTTASVAAQKAAGSDFRALNSRVQATEAQRKADAAAHSAQKAIDKAAVDPSIGAKGEAAEKAAKAADADAYARRAAEQAARDAERAAEDAAKAQAAADAEAKAQMLDQTGWGSGGDPVYYTPPELPADFVPPTSSGVGALVPIGAGAAAGFFAMGPLGALVGAAAGYFISRR